MAVGGRSDGRGAASRAREDLELGEASRATRLEPPRLREGPGSRACHRLERSQNKTEGPRGLRILGVTIGGEAGGEWVRRYRRFRGVCGRGGGVGGVRQGAGGAFKFSWLILLLS